MRTLYVALSIAFSFAVVSQVGAAEEAPAPPASTTPAPAPRESAAKNDSLDFLSRIQAAVGELGLDSAQKKKIEVHFDEAKKALEKIAPGGQNDATVNQTMKTLHDRLASVLTNAQKRELAKKMEYIRQDAMIDRIKRRVAELNLTQEQKDGVSRVLDDTKRQLDDLRLQTGKTSKEIVSQSRDIIAQTQRKLQEILAPKSKQ